MLEGGKEFHGRMAEADRQAMALAGGDDAPISIIPAAAAPDNNQVRAGNNGVTWFRQLGARHVTSLPLVDEASANDPYIADNIRRSGMVFLLGGFPGYLQQTLESSLSWSAATAVEQSGGVIAGSSAGAMVLCEMYYDPLRNAVAHGLNLIPGTCVLPHHDTYGSTWLPFLREWLPDTIFIGIDEETGMISDRRTGTWQVYGGGEVTLYREHRVERYPRSREFQIP